MGGGNRELSLPRAPEADGPVEKVRDYALDPDHPTGTHKARVFRSVLGLEQKDWAFLPVQILDRLGSGDVTAIRPMAPYGTEYEVRIVIDGLNGITHPIVTGWLVPADGSPRLVTAYVELPRRG